MLPSSPWRGDSSSVESACSATRDLSLFKPHLKTSSSTTPSRRSPYSSSSAQRGPARQFSWQSSSQRFSSPFRLLSSKKGDWRFQKKSSATPHNGEVVGSKSLVPLWRSATAWPTPGWLGGLWSGLLDSGDSAGWLSDPLRLSTSSIRAASLPAGVLASAHQGSRLNPGTSDPFSEGNGRTSPSVSGLLQQSLPRPEGFGVVAPHHWLLTLND